MWFAKEFLQTNDDCIILNADLFIEDDGISRLLSVDKSPLFLADTTRIENADFRFQWTGDRILRASKDLRDDETTGEYVGIAKISGDDLQFARRHLDDLINEGEYLMWWEDAFYTQIELGRPLFVEDIRGCFWAELDFIEDYQRVLDHIARS